MTIRYKANISQQIMKLDHLNAGPRQSWHSNQPPTPEFVNGPAPNFNSIALLRQATANFSSNMTGFKQQSIKALDDKINSIMKKHTKNVEQTDEYDIRNPLPASNSYKHSTPYKATQYTSQSPGSKNEYLRKYQQNTRDVEKENKRQMKEQCRRLRERSMIIFEEGTSKQAQKQMEDNYNIESKYDNEIQKLNERIKLAQQKKKQLNIEFSPFSKQRLTDYKNKTNSINQQLIDKSTRSKNKQQLADSIKNKSTFVEPKGCIKRNSMKTPSELTIQTAIKTSPFRLKEGTLSQTQPLKGSSSNSGQITNDIVQAFIAQIKFDEELRNLKIWFTFSNQKDKWDYLKRKIKRQSIDIADESLKNIFESGIEEHNPFFRWDGVTFQEGVERMLKAYQDSEDHWQNCIAKHWSSKQLNCPQLKKAILYDERATCVTLQDLVRFINMQKDTFYRNRDLFLIYRRLCSKTTSMLQYSSFIDALCVDGA